MIPYKVFQLYESATLKVTEENQRWAPGWQQDEPDELSLHESVSCLHPFSAAAPGDGPPLFSPPTPEDTDSVHAGAAETEVKPVTIMENKRWRSKVAYLSLTGEDVFERRLVSVPSLCMVSVPTLDGDRCLVHLLNEPLNAQSSSCESHEHCENIKHTAETL